MTSKHFIVVVLWGTASGFFGTKAVLDHQPEWWIMALVCVIMAFAL